MMDERKQYLYQMITSWRMSQNRELLNLNQLCINLETHVLVEKDKNMFPTGEIFYYVLYPDGKSCIVIHDKIDRIYHKEIIAYSLLRIALIKKFQDKSLVQQLPDGTIMESFFEKGQQKIDYACQSMMYELLVPSSEIPISLYRTLNTSKIELLANQFEVRPKLLTDRCRELFAAANGLLEGMVIRNMNCATFLNRYLDI